MRALTETLNQMNACPDVDLLGQEMSNGLRAYPHLHDLINAAYLERKAILEGHKTFDQFFSAKESKIRKVWLFSFALFFALFIFAAFTETKEEHAKANFNKLLKTNQLLKDAYEQTKDEGFSHEEIFQYLYEVDGETGLLVDSRVILLATVTSLAVFIPAGITYYCAYKKRGTGWLTWTLIVAPFRLLASIVEDFKAFNSSDYNTLFFFIIVAVVYSIWGFYLFGCWRLREVNSEAKARSQLKFVVTPTA